MLSFHSRLVSMRWICVAPRSLTAHWQGQQIYYSTFHIQWCSSIQRTTATAWLHEIDCWAGWTQFRSDVTFCSPSQSSNWKTLNLPLRKSNSTLKSSSKRKTRSSWIVWNKSTCHLRVYPDSDSPNWFSCADLRSELIHLQSAAGCSAGAVSPAHHPAAICLHWQWLCVHICSTLLHSAIFWGIPHCCRKKGMYM